MPRETREITGGTAERGGGQRVQSLEGAASWRGNSFTCAERLVSFVFADGYVRTELQQLQTRLG